MISLRVPPDQAMALVRRIPHARARAAVDAHWKMTASNQVDPRSICWLFCWAKTGMGSADAARAAQRAFDAIFDKPYDWFAARVDHAWAQEARYADRDITAQLEVKLTARS